MGTQVVVFGEVLIDLFAEPASQRSPGTRAFRLEGVPGGAPCNVAAHLAHQGVPVAFATAFADDHFGAELRALLAERKVDISRSTTIAGTRTPLAMVQLGPDGERTFRLYLAGSVVEHVTFAAFGPDVFGDDSKARWFHFGSVLMAYKAPYQATLSLLKQAQQRQMLVSCDLNIRPDVWDEAPVPNDALWDMLRYVDLLKISDEDFAWFRKHVAAGFDPQVGDPPDLLQWGPALICWTHGAGGATLCTDAAQIHVPAPQVDVVDTTGAGDAFAAGLLAALLRQGISTRSELASAGHDILAGAGAFAASRAAAILTQRGALPPL